MHTTGPGLFLVTCYTSCGRGITETTRIVCNGEGSLKESDSGSGGGDGSGGLYCGVREHNISLLDIYCGLQVKPWPGHSIRPIRRY